MNRNSNIADDAEQVDSRKLSRVDRSFPWWVTVIVIGGAILLAVGAVIAKLDPTMLTNGDPMTAAARVYADYVFARDLPLAVMLILLLAIRARRLLAGFMVLIAFMQVLDVINDLVRGAFILVPGLLIFAIVFFIGASQLFGQPFWHLNSWREP